MLLIRITVEKAGWTVISWVEAGEGVIVLDKRVGLNVLAIDVTISLFEGAPVKTMAAGTALAAALKGIDIDATIITVKPPVSQHPSADTLRIVIGRKSQ